MYSCICSFLIYPSLDRHDYIFVMIYAFIVMLPISEEYLEFRCELVIIYYNRLVLMDSLAAEYWPLKRTPPFSSGVCHNINNGAVSCHYLPPRLGQSQGGIYSEIRSRSVIGRWHFVFCIKCGTREYKIDYFKIMLMLNITYNSIKNDKNTEQSLKLV